MLLNHTGRNGDQKSGEKNAQKREGRRTHPETTKEKGKRGGLNVTAISIANGRQCLDGKEKFLYLKVLHVESRKSKEEVERLAMTQEPGWRILVNRKKKIKVTQLCIRSYKKEFT